jgi:glycosyltransferase involved in cell wall biosynthesis
MPSHALRHYQDFFAVNPSRSFPTAAAAPQIRVRVPRGLAGMPYVIDLGQRNARLIKRPMTPFKHPMIRLLRLSGFLSWTDAFAILPDVGWDALHTLNAVPLFRDKPFIITFEDYMPRVPEDRYIGWLERWLRTRLLSNRCVALIALSEFARRQFRWQNRDYPELAALEAKLHLIYPVAPQRVSRPRGASDKLKLLFVGFDFMRKGAPALVRAHERLKAQGVPVETTVVSSLKWSPHDYIGPPDKNYVRAEIARMHDSDVRHVGTMPRLELLGLMERVDYLVLPTFHDTFGFVSVDALSCATPVIATETCAQSEVVEHGECGYLLPFPNDPNVGKWTWTYRTADPGYLDAYNDQIEALADSLTERLMECWEQRHHFERLSAGALARVADRFDRDTARDRLEDLYRRFHD